ncbi:MAG TPA: hypothetical protein PK746_06120, partial [Spirochaetales bacterium]|nr:hypothetical protein [Spirochaetales bacterium]
PATFEILLKEGLEKRGIQFQFIKHLEADHIEVLWEHKSPELIYIIERALKKYGPTVQVLPSHALAEHVLANNFFACLFNEAKTNTGESYSISSIQFESTKYGIALLPDISHGAGPLYIAMLLKHSE